MFIVSVWNDGEVANHPYLRRWSFGFLEAAKEKYDEEVRAFNPLNLGYDESGVSLSIGWDEGEWFVGYPEEEGYSGLIQQRHILKSLNCTRTSVWNEGGQLSTTIYTITKYDREEEGAEFA